MIKKRELPYCPIATLIRIIGGKWKILIIGCLERRPWGFNELLKELEGISRRVLSESLRALESDGIVERKILSETPRRVEYSLNELGVSLLPALGAMERWGRIYKARMEKSGEGSPG